MDGLVPMHTRWLVAFALATAVQFGPGWRFYRAGWAAACHGSPDMNTLVAAVSVLIIACPCAMGLATPVSVMVGMGRAAELGVLFRKGEALQTLSEATTIALHKTGTLTEGRPRLTDLVLAPGEDRSKDDLLELVAAVEGPSEHPVARALVEAAEERGLDMPLVSGFEALHGMGVRGTVGEQRVEVGVAIGTGTDVAIEAADVVLMRGDRSALVDARALSAATLRNVKQNLFWAFAYNVVLIPVAAGALYPVWGVLLSPVWGAAAMGLSSVFVLTNALRLRRFRAPRLAAAG